MQAIALLYFDGGESGGNIRATRAPFSVRMPGHLFAAPMGKKMQILCQEEWRVERIKKALRIALAICGLSQDQAEKLIATISDNKGTLAVVWVTEPTAAQRNAFAVAWAECKEPAENVSHAFPR